MIVQNGLNYIRDRIYDLYKYGAVGTSDTEVSVGDTDLIAEISGSQKAIDSIVKGTNQVKLKFTLASGDHNGNVIREFEVNDGATMLVRVVLPTGIEKTSDNTLDIHYATLLEQESL